MQKALQVSQVNRIIKDIIDNEIILENISVVGEISSFSITRGTAYFVIKDNESMLSCVMFNCKSNFNIGDSVIVKGAVKYYAKGGKLTFTAYHIEHSGEGELYKQFLILKAKLEAEGLFDSLNKKQIPTYINRVGVVTSKTGAVIQDIINIRNRRNPNLDIVLYDCQVQGALAKNQIVEGINFFSDYPNIDCIIVARGGGSIEDLQPFNEEEVARAIFNCSKPIISAVGHETDWTIADFVADMRAPTPTAAAEIVTYDKQELKRTITFYNDKIVKNIKNIVQDNEICLNFNISKIESLMVEFISNLKLNLSNYSIKLENCVHNLIENAKYRVALCLNTLDNLNPARVMAKGYSVIKKEGIFQKDYSNLKINDIITVENNCEVVNCTVNNISKK